LREHPRLKEFRTSYVWRCDASGTPNLAGTHMCINARMLETDDGVTHAASSLAAQLLHEKNDPNAAACTILADEGKFVVGFGEVDLSEVGCLMANFRRCTRASYRADQVFRQAVAYVVSYQLIFFIKNKMPGTLSTRQIEQFERRYADVTRRGKDVLDMAFTGALPSCPQP
jgi:hypothetical protein